MMPSFRRHLLVFLLAARFPAAALTYDAAIGQNLQTMQETDDEATFYRAAQDIVSYGPDVVVPDLTRRLLDTDNDEERTGLTFLLAAVLGPAKMAGETITLPPELVAEMAALMTAPRDLALEGNLANLAGLVEPQPAEITEGLLSILARAEHEGLRATTSAVIAMHGTEDALPLVHAALRQSGDDRYSGDLALILRGTELPEDVAGTLQALLASDNAQARQSASRTLNEAGIRGPGQLDAALRDLADASTDMELLNATMAVGEHTDNSERVARALASALGQARRGEERREILRVLAASGDAGLDQIYRIIRATEDPDLLRQYILGMNSTREAREDPRTLALLMDMATQNDTPAIADQAAFGLNPHGATAVAAIDRVLADTQTSDEVRARLQPVRDRLAK